MVIKRKESNIKFEISSFLLQYLQHSKWDIKMRNSVSSLLHKEGKLFNAQSHFTWSEFSYYVFSLSKNNKTDEEKKIACSAAVELLILATDIIDDITDQDFANESSMLSKLTISEALTISNTLLMESFSLIINYSDACNLEKYKSMINNLRTAAFGQWKDLLFVISKHVPSEADYFALIDQKSVPLIRLVFEMSKLTNDTIRENIPRYIGYSGQLKNDARDILLESKSDLIHQKATLPLIKAIEFSQEKDQGWLLKQMNRLNSSENNTDLLNNIRCYITQTGAIDYCFILSKVYMNKATHLLRRSMDYNEEYVEQLIGILEGD
ncbi:polyprenyl synthetase [Sporolactobacillus sp. THM7-7]|nr:polyprenyl synthetase [Sporolactobacillus sp. THM7-7]